MKGPVPHDLRVEAEPLLKREDHAGVCILLALQEFVAALVKCFGKPGQRVEDILYVLRRGGFNAPLFRRQRQSKRLEKLNVMLVQIRDQRLLSHAFFRNTRVKSPASEYSKNVRGKFGAKNVEQPAEHFRECLGFLRPNSY